MPYPFRWPSSCLFGVGSFHLVELAHLSALLRDYSLPVISPSSTTNYRASPKIVIACPVRAYLREDVDCLPISPKESQFDFTTKNLLAEMVMHLSVLFASMEDYSVFRELDATEIVAIDTWDWFGDCHIEISLLDRATVGCFPDVDQRLVASPATLEVSSSVIIVILVSRVRNVFTNH